MPLRLACPKACGYYGVVESFSPLPLMPEQITTFDAENVCSRDGTVTRSFGKFLSCPFCAYENCREIMHELRVAVEGALCGSTTDRNTLADLLSRIVSTFDGVMRVCNSIAVRNFANGSRYAIAPVNSFQSLPAARSNMLP